MRVRLAADSAAAFFPREQSARQELPRQAREFPDWLAAAPAILLETQGAAEEEALRKADWLAEPG